MANFLDNNGLAYFWGHIKAKLAEKANMDDIYTKTEIDEMLNGSFDCGYYTDTTSGDDFDAGTW